MNTTVDATNQGAAPDPAPSLDDDIRDLLADAKLVADYGVRSGRFGKDATLFEAIRSAVALGSGLGWTSQATVSLQKELGNAIAPGHIPRHAPRAEVRLAPRQRLPPRVLA